MPKRKKKPHDFSIIAHRVVQEATQGDDHIKSESEESTGTKKPDYAALGKLGGKKGGKARAENLTTEQRREIARNAANKRWGNPDQ